MKKTPTERLNEKNRKIAAAKREGRKRGIASPYKLQQFAKAPRVDRPEPDALLAGFSNGDRLLIGNAMYCTWADIGHDTLKAAGKTSISRADLIAVVLDRLQDTGLPNCAPTLAAFRRLTTLERIAFAKTVFTAARYSE